MQGLCQALWAQRPLECPHFAWNRSVLGSSTKAWSANGSRERRKEARTRSTGLARMQRAKDHLKGTGRTRLSEQANHSAVTLDWRRRTSSDRADKSRELFLVCSVPGHAARDADDPAKCVSIGRPSALGDGTQETWTTALATGVRNLRRSSTWTSTGTPQARLDTLAHSSDTTSDRCRRWRRPRPSMGVHDKDGTTSHGSRNME